MSAVIPSFSGQEVWRGDGQRTSTKSESFPSGLAPLDQALALGGLPLGGVTEIRAPVGQGGLSLAIHACATVLENPLSECAVVDGPRTLYAPAVMEAGVPPARLWCVRPRSPAQACLMGLKLLQSGIFRLVVIDQQAISPPKPELQVRRLSVAAQQARAGVILLTGPWAEHAPLPLPSALRLGVRRQGPRTLILSVDKQRGSAAQVRLPVHGPLLDNRRMP